MTERRIKERREKEIAETDTCGACGAVYECVGGIWELSGEVKTMKADIAGGNPRAERFELPTQHKCSLRSQIVAELKRIKKLRAADACAVRAVLEKLLREADSLASPTGKRAR